MTLKEQKQELFGREHFGVRGLGAVGLGSRREREIFKADEKGGDERKGRQNEKERDIETQKEQKPGLVCSSGSDFGIKNRVEEKERSAINIICEFFTVLWTTAPFVL